MPLCPTCGDDCDGRKISNSPVQRVAIVCDMSAQAGGVVPQIEAGGVRLVCDPADASDRFFINAVYDEVALTWTYTRVDNGAVVLPGVDFGVCPDIDYEYSDNCYEVVTGGSGVPAIVAGDILTLTRVYDNTLQPPTQVEEIWFNETQIALMTTDPDTNDIISCPVTECSVIQVDIICLIEDATGNELDRFKRALLCTGVYRWFDDDTGAVIPEPVPGAGESLEICASATAQYSGEVCYKLPDVEIISVQPATAFSGDPGAAPDELGLTTKTYNLLAADATPFTMTVTVSGGTFDALLGTAMINGDGVLTIEFDRALDSLTIDGTNFFTPDFFEFFSQFPSSVVAGTLDPVAGTYTGPAAGTWDMTWSYLIPANTPISFNIKQAGGTFNWDNFSGNFVEIPAVVEVGDTRQAKCFSDLVAGTRLFFDVITGLAVGAPDIIECPDNVLTCESICLVDDASGAIVQQFLKTIYSNGTIQWMDENDVIVPAPVPLVGQSLVDCANVGDLVRGTAQRMQTFTGPAQFSRPPMIHALTVMVQHIDDILNPSTIKDHLGNVNNLFAGDVLTWEAADNSPLVDNFDIAIQTNDIIRVLMEELVI